MNTDVTSVLEFVNIVPRANIECPLIKLLVNAMNGKVVDVLSNTEKWQMWEKTLEFGSDENIMVIRRLLRLRTDSDGEIVHNEHQDDEVDDNEKSDNDANENDGKERDPNGEETEDNDETEEDNDETEEDDDEPEDMDDSEANNEMHEMDIDDDEDDENEKLVKSSPNSKDYDCSFLFDERWKTDFYRRNMTSSKKGRFLSTSTISQYRSQKVWERMRPEPLKDIDSSLEALKKDEPSLDSLSKRLNALKAFLRNMTSEERRRLLVEQEKEDKIHTLHEEVLMEIEDDKFEKNQYPTQKEIDNMISPVETLRKVDENLKNIAANPGLHSTAVLERTAHTSLLVKENGGAPRRNEYAGLTYDPNDDNYYEAGEIVLRKYKTSEVYGPYRFHVSVETQAVLDELSKRKREQGIKQIFGRKNVKDIWTQWSRRTEGHFLAIVGKPLTTRLVRKYYTTYQQLNGYLAFNRDKLELARKMGNKVKEQQEVYTLRLDGLKEPGIQVPGDTESVNLSSERKSSQKRKKKMFWTAEEETELENLTSEVGYDPNRILELARERDLILARRTVDRIRQKSEQIKSDRERSGIDVGAFRDVVVRDAIQNRKRRCVRRDSDDAIANLVVIDS